MKARWYLDFDGTLTGTSGGTVIKSSGYKLLINEESRLRGDAYNKATFLPERTMTLLLRKQISEDPTLGLTPGAKDFITTKLSNGDDIVIVSKNRQEYIKALLLAEGLTQDQLDKITIYDTNQLDTTRKIVEASKSCNPLYIEATQSAAKAEAKPTKCAAIVYHEFHNMPLDATDVVERIYVCDDDPKDYIAMKAAAEAAGSVEVIAINHQTGEFAWSKMRGTVGLESLPAGQDSGVKSTPSDNLSRFSPSLAAASSPSVATTGSPRLFTPSRLL